MTQFLQNTDPLSRLLKDLTVLLSDTTSQLMVLPPLRTARTTWLYLQPGIISWGPINLWVTEFLSISRKLPISLICQPGGLNYLIWRNITFWITRSHKRTNQKPAFKAYFLCPKFGYAAYHRTFEVWPLKTFALFLHFILLSRFNLPICYIFVISNRCFHNFFDTTLL